MRLTRTLASISAVLWPWTAHACTVCDSPTGKQLRAGLFDDSFGHTLLLVAAPIPVFVAAVLLLHLGMPELPEELDERAADDGSAIELSATELLA